MSAPESRPRLEPIRIETVPSTSERVMESLTEYLFAGGTAPGEKLPSERQLAEMMNVPRSAVREALQSLKLIGAIDIRQGSGAYLRPGSSELLPKAIQWGLFLGETKVSDLVEARHEIEIITAGLAAQHCSDEELEALERILAKMRNTLEGGDEYVDIDLEFHRTIAEAARNGVLKDVLYSVTGLLRSWMTRSLRVAGDTRSSTADHEAIFEAIKSRDIAGAREAMRLHMEGARIRLNRTLTKYNT